MVETRILLSALWAATMLTYLLGDVLRIFAGDFEPGKIQGAEGSPAMYMLMAVIMLIPILMVVLTLVIPYPAVRWTTIVVAIIVVIFNLIGLPYEGMYDNFLIIVSIIFNALMIWYAWQWAG
jgi:hypothetical protein